MPRFRDIPQFTRSAGYCVNVGLDHLPIHYAKYVQDYGLDVSPDFQRGYVWTPEQKVRFVEYMLRGGVSGLDIYCNSPNWQHGAMGATSKDKGAWFVLVDGKQRLDAALGFLSNEFPVFDGHYFRDFTDKPRITQCNFRWHVNDLQTREEVLQWYLDLNSGGTVHSESELDTVRALIRKGGTYERPSADEIKAHAHLDREIIQTALREERERDERWAAERRALEEKAAADLIAKKAAAAAKGAATRAANRAAKGASK